MEIKSSTPLQEAIGATQASSQAREDMAPSQAQQYAEIAEAFTWGYSEWGHDLSERSLALFEDLINLDVRVPATFAESQGANAGLVDMLYMRRDHLEHQAVIAILNWAKLFSLVVPVDLVYAALGRIEPRMAVIKVLGDTLNTYDDLRRNVQTIIADARAKALAEGTVSSGSLLNHSKGVPVPDMNGQHAKELAANRESPDYGKDASAALGLILSGLAGDLIIHTDALKNQGASEDKVKGSISPTLAAGLGAAFYLGSSVHDAYTDGQLSQIKDAGEKVDFVTSGDGRVCAQCHEAEAGNPWPVDSAPPIPNHGGCRCWYAAAGTI